MDIQTLKQNLVKYKNLRNSVNDICNSLKKTKSPLSGASNDIKTLYLFDEHSADNGQIYMEYNNIVDIIISLEQEILPELNYKINKLQRDITDLEAATAAVI